MELSESFLHFIKLKIVKRVFCPLKENHILFESYDTRGMVELEISIAGRKIGTAHEPYIIAEMSANHNGSIDHALKIIKMANDAGADAVKMQTYRPDTITLNSSSDDFKIEGGLWHGRTLHDLYHEAHTPWEWHRPLFDYARTLGITIFSSPFDHTAVDFLETLDAPAYKIASFEAIDLPLIRKVAATGKPVIISTGMCNLLEIERAIGAARGAGCQELVVLRCVSAYPASAEEYNLSTIYDVANKFNVLTGLSDHTLDNTIAIASVALGGSVVEKHVTLDRSGGGPDDSFSLEFDDLKKLVAETRQTWKSIGHPNYGPAPSERVNIKFRRSLYFVENILAGDVITADAVRSVRPGYGIEPRLIDKVVGAKAARDILANTPVRDEDFE